MALTDYVIMPGADYQALCDKIREKTGKTGAIKSGDLVTEVEEVSNIGASGGNDGEATIGRVSKAVNFYNVDGDIVYSYTRAEAAELTELPPVPELGDLDGSWTKTLEQVNSVQGFLDVGALYKKNGNPTVVAVVRNLPTDVSQVFCVTLAASSTLNIYHSPDHTTPDQTQTSGTSEKAYKIAITNREYDPTKNKCYYVFEFVTSASYKCKIGGNPGAVDAFCADVSNGYTMKTGTKSASTLLLALTTSGISQFYQYSIYNDYSLKYVCSTSINASSYVFYNCFSLKNIVTNNGYSTTSSYNCYYCYNIEKMTVQQTGGTYFLSGQYSLESLLFTGSGKLNLSYMVSCKDIILLSETPMTATFSVNLVYRLQNIYVPDDAVDAYKAHASWSAYSDYIRSISEYPDY